MALTKAHSRMIADAAVNVKDFGAVGDGVTDDTAALGSAVDAAVNSELIFPYGTYTVSSPDTYEYIKITGDFFPKLESSVTNGQLGSLKNNVVLENMTIDGNNGTSNILAIGSSTAGLTDNVWINQNLASNAPSNLFRVNEYGSKIVISNNQTSNCKLFNTWDSWTGYQFIVYGNIIDNVSGEASLFESPARKADWNATLHYGNIYQNAVNGQRTIGYAGIKGFVDSNNIYRGNTGVTKDSFHIEDSSEFGVVSGNLISANGAPAAIDCALGGDTSYLHFESASGSFTNGETITGGTSGAAATVNSLVSPEVLSVTVTSGTFEALETITGGSSGVTATVSRRDTKSVLLTSNTILPDGEKGIEMQGSSPSSFEKITLSNNHIESSSAPINARLSDSAVINNVMYDPESPIIIYKSDASGANNDSPTAHNVYVTDNYYVKPAFIRGNVGLCFDPNNLLFRTSFADSGSGLTIGGSLGTGGSLTYPLSVAGDGIAGVKYLRNAAGTTANSKRIDLDFDSTAVDVQNGDSISIQIMCRSSVPNRGKITIGFLSAGPSSSSVNLPTTTEWQVLGMTKNIPSTADMFAAGAGTPNILIDVFLGENLGNGEYLDVAWIKVSHVRGY